VKKKMTLKIVGNINGNYHGKIVSDIYMTDAEACVAGTAYKLSSQRWTEAVGTDRIYGIGIKAVTLGTDVFGVVELVKDGDIIEADYTGTPNAAFIVGCESATLGDATGLTVDSTDVTSGCLVILEKDTTNTKIRCIATKNFVQAS
jgi:hypothetical protein